VVDETLFGEPLSKRLMARKQERDLLPNQITYETTFGIYPLIHLHKNLSDYLGEKKSCTSSLAEPVL